MPPECASCAPCAAAERRVSDDHLSLHCRTRRPRTHRVACRPGVAQARMRDANCPATLRALCGMASRHDVDQTQARSWRAANKCKRVVMLVFLDTKFTDFVRPDLISLALVGEDGSQLARHSFRFTFHALKNQFHRKLAINTGERKHTSRGLVWSVSNHAPPSTKLKTSTCRFVGSIRTYSRNDAKVR